ncbi:hypothetical protein [Bradyrhizobium ottawaense]|uniref:hypothetical protein n=2 Tax=Bradyrhizobium ottawaense TaxID=931866 RepID=UPI0027D54301|nr:hypothetical protein BwSG10_48660 [Bradyrhizobium ottawaense]GMP00649.1 hypothetical protein BwSH20_29560 [Bradyrhizobium ottawaense]GMP05486.1 hypothetical protein BwDG23_48660 [Bradyrhizobium ottawaense]
MPRGQFYTVFTLGFAAAIALFGIAGACALLWWPPAAYWTAWAFGAPGKPLTWMTPTVFSFVVGSATLCLAYSLVTIQQALVRWSGDRLIAKLNRQYNMIAQLQGQEYADEFMRLQAQAMIEESEGKPFNVFGREKMLHAAAAAGVRLQPPT